MPFGKGMARSAAVARQAELRRQAPRVVMYYAGTVAGLRYQMQTLVKKYGPLVGGDAA